MTTWQLATLCPDKTLKIQNYLFISISFYFCRLALSCPICSCCHNSSARFQPFCNRICIGRSWRRRDNRTFCCRQKSRIVARLVVCIRLRKEEYFRVFQTFQCRIEMHCFNAARFLIRTWFSRSLLSFGLDHFLQFHVLFNVIARWR